MSNRHSDRPHRMFGGSGWILQRWTFCFCLLVIFVSASSYGQKTGVLSSFSKTISALSSCPEINPATTLSATTVPVSQYFTPRNHGQVHIPLVSPGSKEVKSSYKSGQTYRIIELRGWLRVVEPMCNGADPDWHYKFELDSEWTDSLGINLNDLIRAGNYLDGGYITEDMKKTIIVDDWYNYDNYSSRETQPVVVSRPIVGIELNGIFSDLATEAPNDWPWDTYGYADSGACQGYRNRGAIGPLPVLWAYNPLNPICGQPALDQYEQCRDWTFRSQHPECGFSGAAADSVTPGWYVRVVGSIITDSPHAYGEDIFGTWTCRWLNWLCSSRRYSRVRSMLWDGDRSDTDENNAARWTEIHPPDVIAILPYKPPAETTRIVLLMSQGNFRILDFDMAPPSPLQSGVRRKDRLERDRGV